MKPKIDNIIQFPGMAKKQSKKSDKPKCKKTKKSAANQLLDDFKDIIDDAQPEQPLVGTTINIDRSTGIQTGDNTTANYHFHQEKPPTLKALPPPDSIGGQALLKKSIQERFNGLGERREKRFGKRAYSVIYNNFKRDFKIPKGMPWTDIWRWPAATAPAIIAYLDNNWQIQ